MKLNEKFYTRTIHGLAECDGKRIDSDYAVIRPWFAKDEYKKYDKRYYVIHISSGLKVSSRDYTTAKAAIENLEEDIKFGKERLAERNIIFEDTVEKGIEDFNRWLNEGKFYKEKEK